MNRSLLPLRTVLVPTDLSPRADAAVDFAVGLAAADGAEVVLLHVFAYPHDWYHWETAALAGLRHHVEQEAEARLVALARRKTTPAVRVRPLQVVCTDVASAVLASAEDERADLVVMGTRGWAGERPQLGSVTAQVVRRGRCPVLAVPRAPAVPAGSSAGSSAGLPLGQVVVPVDGSDAAAGALRAGYALAMSRSVPLAVFHVVDEGALEGETWGGEAVEAADAPLLAQYERRVRRFAERVLGAPTGVRLTCAAATAAGILAEVEPADLLVLAPHHSGHLTEEVLAHAPCPVLVVPALRGEAPAASPVRELLEHV
jgi:nucleotide-binding universal stress UspA family protein